MSIYLTPVSFVTDEEVFFNEDSIYTTPELLVNDRDEKDHCIPSIVENIYSQVKCHVEDNSKRHSFGSVGIKSLTELNCDKENIETNANICQEDLEENTLMKYSTNFGGPDINTLDATNDSPIIEATETIKSIQHRHEDSRKSRFFRRISFLSKSKTNHEIIKKCKSPNITLAADSETIVIRIPKRNYGSICCINPNEVFTDRLRTEDVSQTGLEMETGQKSCSPLFENNKVTNGLFGGSLRSMVRHPIKSVLGKIRLSPVKRLFSNSIGGLHFCYRKYLKRSQKKSYEPLDDSVIANSETVSEVRNGKNILQLLTSELGPIRDTRSSVLNIQTLMNVTITKLTNLENEIKELRSLIEENGIRRCAPPPPPPPPPPPSNSFVPQSSTPKRKADITTPENDHVAKRPLRIHEKKTQFSITVEDLRNVKLRKTGTTFAERVNTTTIDDGIRSVHPRVLKRNRFVKKELSELTTRLLSPKKGEVPELNLVLTESTQKNNVAPSSIYGETPLRSINRYSNTRQFKRKDMSGDSPIKKRLHSNAYSSRRRISTSENV